MERKDFLRQGGPCFYFDTELFAPTTDSFALGWFAAPKRGERVCDLGSGTGLLGTLLLAREPSLTLFCVEQNAAANALAEKGFAENGWAERVTLRTGDLRENAALLAAGSHGLCALQPAVLPGGKRRERRGRGAASRAGRGRLHARRRLCRGGAGAALGRTLRARPQARTAIRPFLHAPRARLEPKRLRFVASSAEKAPSLALVEARRGGKAGLSVEPMLFIGSADWDKVYFRT